MEDEGQTCYKNYHSLSEICRSRQMYLWTLKSTSQNFLSIGTEWNYLWAQS